jgi:hypothetical protein
MQAVLDDVVDWLESDEEDFAGEEGDLDDDDEWMDGCFGPGRRSITAGQFRGR